MCARTHRRGPSHHQLPPPHVWSPLSSCLRVLQVTTVKLPQEGMPLLPRYAPPCSTPLYAAALRTLVMTATSTIGEAPSYATRHRHHVRRRLKPMPHHRKVLELRTAMPPGALHSPATVRGRRRHQDLRLSTPRIHDRTTGALTGPQASRRQFPIHRPASPSRMTPLSFSSP
jgi:hypothetical protein